MASRPTARSSRAAIRQVWTPLQNVWITDSILTAAFERYCNVSRLSRRKSSSVPGPLENRRRLGKRRMTGLYSNEFQPTLPPWMLEFPVDLSQWTWSAPTSAEARKERAANPPLPTRLWRLLVPAATAAEPTPAQPAPAQEIQPDDRISSALDQVFDTLLKSLHLYHGQLPGHYVRIIRKLEQDICLGLVSAADIPDLVARYTHETHRAVAQALGGELDGLSPRQQKTLNRANLRFLTAVVRGLYTSRVQGLGQLDPGTCTDMLSMLSAATRTTETTPVFHMLVRSISASCRNQAMQGIQSYIRTWLTLHVHGTNERLSLNSLAGSFGDVQTDLEEGTRLLEAASAVFADLHAAWEGDLALRIHTTWLELLVRIPHVSDAYLGEALAKHTALVGEWTPALEQQLCKLLVHHWQSQGLIRPGAKVPGHDSVGQLAYSLKTFKLQQSMLALVLQLDARSMLFSSIRAHCADVKASRRITGRRLCSLARATRDHRLALALHLLAGRFRDKMSKSTMRLFHKTLLPHIHAMIQDELVDAGLVWKAINGLPENSELMFRRKMQAMQSMPTWFSQARHLSDRAMLRNISRCNAWVRSKGESPSQESVLAVARAAVRDLQRGEPGRTERHDWVVRLIRQSLGDDQAQKMAKTLLEWRRKNRPGHL